MLDVIFGAALRSLAMGALVFAGLRLFRIRGAAIERAVWTMVLAGAVLIPALMQFATVTVQAPATDIQQQISQTPPLGAIAPVGSPVAPPPFHWKQAITWLYLAIAGVFLIRLIIGVFLTARMWWRARPLDGWQPDCRVLSSAEVRSPVVFGRTILLPESPAEWDEATRRVVLAHERAHVTHGDFFVLLAAKVYRAVFWFSPLSWWLDRHLSDLMEAVCDEEAMREASDRQSYAAVLLEFVAQDDELNVAVAMARAGTLSRRIDRILSGIAPAGQMTKRAWGIVSVAITMLALAASVSVQTRAQDQAGQAPPPPPAAPQAKPRRRPPPPPPPPPAKRSEREPNAFWWQNGGSDEPYAIVSGDGLTMNGSSSDARRARLLRDKIKSDYIWFERDLKFYYIDDGATVARAKELFRPQEDLSRKQAELGEQQAALGHKQAALGAEQAAVAGRADLTGVRRRLEEAAARLRQLGDSSDRSSLDQLQSEVVRVQAQIGSVHAVVGEQQAKLGEQQAELGERQAQLGEQQAELGRQQAEVSGKAVREMKTILDEALSNGLAKKVE